MNIRNAIVGNLLTGSLGRIVNALTPLLLVPFQIRAWGLPQYGEWIILTAIPTYLMLSPDFGLAGATVNQMAIATAEGRKEEAVCLYRTSWLILTALAVFFVLVGFLVGIYMNWRTLGVTKLSGKAAGIVSISCVQIFLGQQMLLIAGVYRSARQNPRCGLLGSIGSAFFLITAIGSLAVSRDPLQFAIVNAGSRAIFLFVMLLDARKILPEFTLSISGVRLRAVQPYIIPGFGHAAMPLINALQNEGMILVLAVFLGPASVAIFQTTRTAVNGAKSAMGLAATAVMVEIPFLIGDRRMDSIRQLLIMNTQVALVAAIGWLVVLGVFGQFIFRIWLHNRTVYSPSLTLILLASIFPFAIANTYTVVLLATNKIHRAVALILPAALISLAVTAAGAYLFGLNGAATGVVTFETLSLLAVCAVTAKHTGIRVRETLIEAASRQSITANYRSALSVLRLTRV